MYNVIIKLNIILLKLSWKFPRFAHLYFQEQYQDADDYGALVKWYWHRSTEVVGVKPVAYDTWSTTNLKRTAQGIENPLRRQAGR